MSEKFSKIGFILSIVGAAIGLGNAWKFPYLVGINGGSAFVLLYLFFAIVVGLSIFFAEMAMGKISLSDTVNAFKKLAPSHSKEWGFAGVIMITGLFVASFYTLIIGWVIRYSVVALSKLPADIETSTNLFGNFISTNAWEQILYFSIAFFAYFFILTKGIKSGIERINLWLIPILFVLLLLMLAYSTSMNGFDKAAEFLLVPDFSKINSDSIFMALGLAFFTMCIGIGAVLTYSSSLDDNTNLFTSSLYVVFLNIITSIIIGLIVFTFVFEFDAQPSQGVGLAFISLPTLFAKLGVLGNVLCFTFFITLVFAGLTSAISMVEPCIFYLNRNFGLSRVRSILIVGSVVYVLGVLCALSNINEVKEILKFFDKSFFDCLDYLSSNIMLPLGGIVISIFVGYFMQVNTLKKLFVPYMGERVFKIWYFLVRYIAPVCVFIVLVKGIL
ncbi:sodium-dependent transporter [Campylobacter sp. RM9344]|uniref:Sodium-dependent transporter n=1 Tax=Campylobacter californiensis TaxID=1032243 RepID=A0AAW3ZY35_9BACT|nr:MULTISPECIES: sodium-dependent transporter [unclassified Campylobacter]MBE2984692.1 sodium-dependent transporter [Campylobacter sp. RM6883]MBE2994608.1 sodium-dependent transporter [Campylobacter sp. RM6913]MBE3029134.1 sodium-dependent transporter [Campylobacter sp. RM9344]MBE3608125.1 sodium-dependent transporter [Campylobacter sp. RM9337]QCD50416.1 Na+-dependent transporter, SNF family [Campylobacter sp. RM6914]